MIDDVIKYFKRRKKLDKSPLLIRHLWNLLDDISYEALVTDGKIDIGDGRISSIEVVAKRTMRGVVPHIVIINKGMILYPTKKKIQRNTTHKLKAIQSKLRYVN